MINQLPNFIFKKAYENSFLFTEFDIIFNEDFYARLIDFLINTNAKKLFFELERSDNTEMSKSLFEYENPTITVFDEFYTTKVKFGAKSVLTQFFNHFIYSDVEGWKIYISPEFEMSIFVCDCEVIDDFLRIFKPYEDEDFNTKVKIIGDMFSDSKARNMFFDKLKQNYPFG